ncbi:MAG: hypothetical protein CL932_10910 [Deltaproteobacteria bacterium]|nr:hypothetical protein [Deltaproteobacteria bacterium]MBK05278.1 hypothetical protein [Deltaproteobacteria bacterium]
MLTQNLQSGHGPCPVTGKKQNWSYKGPSHNPTFVIVYGNIDTVGAGWIFSGENSIGGQMFRREGGPEDKKQPEYIDAPPNDRDIQSRPRLAEVETRHTVYETLFSLCPLTSKHKTHLRKRQLSHKKIRDLLFCGSMPPPTKRPGLAKEVMARSGLRVEELLQVPGFFLNKRGILSIAGSEGIMLPTYDTNGYIQGVQIRSMNTSQSKYLWMSSYKKGGPKGGAPASFFGNKESQYVWITEGSFKAVSLILHGYADAVISIAGVGNIPSALEQLKALPNVKGAMIAYDSDCLTNVNVMSSLARLLHAVEGEELQVAALSWSKAWGKGIDDALKKGIPKNALCELPTRGLKRWARKTRNFTKIEKKDLPLWRPSQKTKTSQEELRQETFRVIEDAVKRGGRTFNVIENATGSGKTYSTVRHARRGTIFVCKDYKTLYELRDVLIEFYGKDDVDVLYGRIAPPTEESNDLKHHERFQKAGCPNFSEMKLRTSRGHSPCEGCPFNPKNPQKKTEEGGEGEEKQVCAYWKQRLRVFEETKPFLLCVKQTFTSNPQIRDLLPESPNLDLMGKQYLHVVVDDCPDIMTLLAHEKYIRYRDIEEWRTHPGMMKDDPEHQLAKEWAGTLATFFGSAEINEVYGLYGKNEPKPLQLLRQLSKALLSQEEIICEQPHPDDLPMKSVRSLATWLAKGGSVYFSKNKKGKKLMSFLSPPDELFERLQNTTLNILDATADRLLLSWFASLLKMSFNAPETTKSLPRIIQVFDKLWDKSQVKQYKDMFEKLISAIKEKDKKSLTLAFKGFEDMLSMDGHWGRDERGLNCYEGAKWMLLVGHYALPEEDALKQAWMLRALAHHMGGVSPDEYIKGKSFGKMRKYHDEWRPWEREMYVSEDHLAEHIRRHHATSTVVQGVGRPRNPNVNVLLFNGEPLDGLQWDIPVEALTTEEILYEMGIEWTPTPAPTGGGEEGGGKKIEKKSPEEEKKSSEGASFEKCEQQDPKKGSQNEITSSRSEIADRDQDHEKGSHLEITSLGSKIEITAQLLDPDRLFDPDEDTCQELVGCEEETFQRERVFFNSEGDLFYEEEKADSGGLDRAAEGVYLSVQKTTPLASHGEGQGKTSSGIVGVEMEIEKNDMLQMDMFDFDQIESPQKGVALISLKRALPEIKHSNTHHVWDDWRG